MRPYDGMRDKSKDVRARPTFPLGLQAFGISILTDAAADSRNSASSGIESPTASLQHVPF